MSETPRFHQKVQTPDGDGVFIGMLHDRRHALVAVKVLASSLDEDTIARYCRAYESMNAAEKAAYKQKALYPCNREYPLEEISYK
jgi:hypothetical protein